MAGKKAKRFAWRSFVVLLMAAFMASGGLRLWGEGRAFATDEQSAPLPLPTPEQMSLPEINTVIDALNKREAMLDAQAREIELAQADLNLARQEIQARLDELAAAETRLAERMALSNEASATDLGQLTRVYEAMKPKVAAELFSAMEPSFAAEFLVRMNAENAAAIFSSLGPEAAYALSAVMAGRNALAATGATQ